MSFWQTNRPLDRWTVINLVSLVLFTIGYHQAVVAGDDDTYTPVSSFVRLSSQDATNPEFFVAELKKHIILALTKDGLLQPGYPKPCRFEGPTDREHFCVADPSASLDTTGPFLLNEERYYMQFSVIQFLSPMPYIAQIYLVPEQAYAQFQRADMADRDRNFQRVLVRGAIPTIASHKAIVHGIFDAGVIAYKR